MVSFLRWFKQPGLGHGTVLTSQVRYRDGWRWVDPPGPGPSSQTGHQSGRVSLHARNTVPQFLYYDCNPAIKSYSCSMRSQLNEWESTLCLCVSYKPQIWTRAKTDTWLLPSSCPLWQDIKAGHLRSDTGGLVIHPTQSLLLYWILYKSKEQCDFI